MLRCTQELITNSIKHAQAKNLWIHFSKNENEVIFSIEDDGTGDSQSLREGNGLTGIRERVKQFNGEIEILNKSQGICVNIILRAS